MAATANEKTDQQDETQGRLPFKVLDIKTALQRPSTKQLKRKRSCSDERKATKVMKSENLNCITIDTDAKNTTNANVSKKAENLSSTILANFNKMFSRKQTLESAQNEVVLIDAQTMQTVKEVLQDHILDVIDRAPETSAKFVGKEAGDELNSTFASSGVTSSIQSGDSDLNCDNDERSIEVVTEGSKTKEPCSEQKSAGIGRAKIKRNKEDKEKRKAERERLRREKEKKLSEAKEEKRRLSEAARQKREQEKVELKMKRLREKEEAKERIMMKKEQEHREREEKMQEKVKARDQEKEEKRKILEEKKQLMNMKQEEKKKREEEKQKKLDEKKKYEEEEERKKKKVSAAFESFFIKNEPTVPLQKEEKHSLFKPFQLKKDMMLASIIPTSVSASFDPTIMETYLQSQDCQKLYLEELKTQSRKQYRASTKKGKQEDKCEDVILENRENISMKAKLFYFRENVRPPYWGTWRKKSQTVKPRNPFKKDAMFDYEVDSDEEWDEGGPGESLSGTEEEKESEDDYEVDNEFFVPHGYLSADEEKDEDGDAEMHKIRLKVREKEFEEELKRKCSQLKPCILGCLWSKESDEELYKALAPYQAIVLFSSLPIVGNRVKDGGDGNASPGGSPSDSQKKKLQRTFPEEAMPYLIKLIHANTNGKSIIAMEFKEFWSMQSSKTEESATTAKFSDDSPKERTPFPVISKGLVEVTLKKIATYMKNPVHSAKRCWWVHEDVRVKYNLLDLPPVNRWQYVSRDDIELTPPLPKTPNQSIIKFATKLTPFGDDKMPNSTPPSRRVTEDMSPKVSKTPRDLKSKTPGKKRSMSILHFTKRLKTEEKNGCSSSNTLKDKKKQQNEPEIITEKL